MCACNFRGHIGQDVDQYCLKRKRRCCKTKLLIARSGGSGAVVGSLDLELVLRRYASNHDPEQPCRSPWKDSADERV
jgi:hypothetical protein